MGKWLDRLREHEKNKQVRQNGTDKTDTTPSETVLSVLSVHSEVISANFLEEAAALHDERAGILEYDFGLPRDEAERLARLQINDTIH